MIELFTKPGGIIHSLGRSKKKDEQKKRIPIQGTLTDEEVDTTHYWIYSAGSGSVMWEEFYDAGIMAIGWGDIGDLRKFASKEAMRKSMRENDPSLSRREPFMTSAKTQRLIQKMIISLLSMKSIVET